jgi:CubicO group peptidase (beta-lactamase class C family)
MAGNGTRSGGCAASPVPGDRRSPRAAAARCGAVDGIIRRGLRYLRHGDLREFAHMRLRCCGHAIAAAALLAAGNGAAVEAPATADGIPGVAPQATFPGQDWQAVDDPRRLGWEPAQLRAARDVFARSGAAALFLVVHGQVLADWGSTSLPYPAHSLRKSLASALIGNAVTRGHIDLDASLASLGIDDRTPLSAQEARATVRDLLAARSGIYLPANAQGQQQVPARGSAAPGTQWVYNNWDFNALGTIYERATGSDLFTGFGREIAEPVGMQDFDVQRHAHWVRDAPSDHAAYAFDLSARDLARFGLLFLHGGRWHDRQVVPADWVRLSTSVHSHLAFDGRRMVSSPQPTGHGYGYMWWVGTLAAVIGDARLAGSFSAEGHRGHLLLVAPRLDMVLVVRVDTRIPEWLPLLGERLDGNEAVALIRALLAAAPAG